MIFRELYGNFQKCENTFEYSNKKNCTHLICKEKFIKIVA